MTVANSASRARRDLTIAFVAKQSPGAGAGGDPHVANSIVGSADVELSKAVVSNVEVAVGWKVGAYRSPTGSG